MASGSSSDRDRCKHTDVETEEVCVCTKFDPTESEDKLLCRRCGHHASFHVPGDAIKSRRGKCSKKSDSVCEDGCQEFFPSRESRLPKNCGGCGCHSYDHNLSEVHGDAEIVELAEVYRDADIVEPKSGLAGDGSNVVDRDDALAPRHKVFLSFSGAQRHFAEKLHDEVVKRDRYPFYDRKRSCLPLGENAPNLMWEAIKTCRIGVVIFSEDYFTRTKWPMLEFVRMVRELKRNKNPIKIIPVFLGISHDDCRDRKKHEHWSETWKKWASLEKNKQLYKIDVTEWVKSVQEYFDQPLQRLELRSEGQKRDLRKEIVDAICTELRPDSTFALPIVQGHARLYENFRKVIFPETEGENANPKVRVVGLYGVGGVGKTTLCKVLRYELSREFCDKVCHVNLGVLSKDEVFREVIREFVELEPQELVNLKYVANFDVFLSYFDGSKLGKRVFLAIDNVTDDPEMMDLSVALKNVKWHNGSVLLITARFEDVLNRIGIDQSQCFKMLDLTEEEAEALFLNSVRSVDSNVNVDKALVAQCLLRCHFSKGLATERHWHPLALVVLGKQLMYFDRKNFNRWKQQLEKIDTFNAMRSRSAKHPIFSILRTSFDALEDDEKWLFMDVAVFKPQGDIMSSLLEQSGLSVVPWSDDESDDEGDHKWGLRRGLNKWVSPMGFIVPTRADDVVSVFKWLCMVHDKEDDVLKDMLDSLKRKSVLETVNDNDKVIAMHDLWYEFAIEETTLRDITKQCWIRESKNCKGLSKADNVRSMRLNDVSLRNLDLTGFPMISVLTVQKRCDQSDRLTRQPIMTLNVNKLDRLKSLEVIINSSEPCGLDIKGLGLLESLVFLRIWNLSYFAWLEEIKFLKNLQILDLENFDGDKLPDFRELPNLRVLNLRSSKKLKSVDLENLPNLTDLDVDFRDLKKLSLSSCTSLRNVWGLQRNDALQELRISSCQSLEELPGLQNCKELIVLNISNCPRIESVPNLRHLKKLKEFVIKKHASMEALQNKTLEWTKPRLYVRRYIKFHEH